MLVAIVLTLTNCTNRRPPSRERFEIACNLELPRKFKVTRDEFHDRTQDFILFYTLKLDSLSMHELSGNIKKSKFYRPDIKIDSHFIRKQYIEENLEAVWIRTYDGYMFRNKNDNHVVTAIIDTISRQADFIESSD